MRDPQERAKAGAAVLSALVASALLITSIVLGEGVAKPAPGTGGMYVGVEPREESPPRSPGEWPAVTLDT